MKLERQDVLRWCEENGYVLKSAYRKSERQVFTSNEARANGFKGMLQDIIDVYGITIDELNQKTRKREIVESRQVAHMLFKQQTVLSLAKIGAMIGNKDHATVLHSCKTVSNLLETDAYFKTIWGFVIDKYNMTPLAYRRQS